MPPRRDVGGGGGGTIVVDIEGVRRASGAMADSGQAFGLLAGRVRGRPMPEMPPEVAGRVEAEVSAVAGELDSLPGPFVDVAQELRVRAFWAEIADRLIAGDDLEGVQLTEFKAAYASGLLTRYADPGLADVARDYAEEVHDREHPGGLMGFVHDVGDFFSGAWDAIKDPAVMIYHLTPFSGDDWTQHWKDLGHGLAYGVTHPVEFGKAVINLDALHERGFSYWIGNLAPAAAATLLSGGAAAGVRGAEGAVAVERAAESAVALDRAAEGAVAAERAIGTARLVTGSREVGAGASDASRAEKLAAVAADASRAGIEAPFEGQDLYRVFGRTEDILDVEPGSRPFGGSWTPVNPATLENPRAELGLPDVNRGRFVIHGTLKDPSSIVEIRHALPLDGNPGGAPEYVIANSHEAVDVVSVKGVNPDF
jgi:hypothetical protein